MPVGCAVPLRKAGEAEFEAVQYQVNGACFDVHNEHGRLCDERIYLSISLDQEAIMHYLGGRDYVETLIDYTDESTVVGGQRVRLLDKHTAFQITALKDELQGYEIHLRRLFQHTPLRSIEWVNISNHDITFTTIP